MRRILWTSGALAAVFALGFTACDSDEGTTGETDTMTAEDTTTGESDTTVAEDTSTEADTTPDDPCDPNPCTTPPAAACNGDATGVITYASPGTCTDNAGTAECAYTSSETACGSDEICSSTTTECLAAGNPCDYTYDDKVSVVTHLAVGAKAGDDGECCFDFDGDEEIDNQLGDLLGLVASVAGDIDVNALIAEQLAEGSLIVLLETVGVDSVTDDDALSINGFIGEDADDDLTNNFSGSGSFIVAASSFKDGTQAPLISFPSASISGGSLTAGPSLFALSLPLFEGVPLSLTITDTSVESVVATGTNGMGLSMDGSEVDGDGVTYGAKLGGVLKRSDLFNALDTFMVSSCAVMNTDNGKFLTDAGDCPNSADVDLSACEEGAPPELVLDYCFAVPIIAGQVDIDTDDDGEPDAYSVGLRLKADSATIVGTEGCE